MTDKAPDEAKLTPKQELFVKEYLIDLNATQASIRAGYSESSAKEIGCENLTKPNIQKAIAETQAERMAKLDINADYVLKRLLEVDQLDVMDILDPNGRVKPVNEWPKEWRTNISSIEVSGDDTQGTVAKLKFPDKVKNLELIGKHITVGAWVTNQNLDITNSDGSMKPTVIELIAPQISDES